MNEHLLDNESRDKIINDLGRNFFVEAGAGSGKTYCLVERMVNLIKMGEAKIENIAAVTFTRKASAELKERFQIRLEQSIKKQTDAKQKVNIQEALSNLEQIFIGTIHSFCSRILHERPVEAGIDPGFNEIKEEEDFSYADNAWSDYIENCHLDKEDRLLDFFEEHGILPDDLKDSYKKIIQFPDVEIINREILKPDFVDTKKQVSQFIEIMWESIPKSIPEKGWDDLQKIIRKSFYLLKNGYLNTDTSFVKLLKDLGKSAKATLNRWPEGNGRSCEERMDGFREQIVRPAIRKWQEYLHKPCIDFIKKGAEFYEKWRKEHSVLNFTDLLTITSGLLRSNPEIRLYFKNKFTHILVDEFQDTDPIQAELFLFLTGADVNEKDWLKITPQPGSLFLVGDPKQSIYRFRRADISIYESVKEIFCADSKFDKGDDSGNKHAYTGEVLPLFSNFRSLPFMKELVEEVFGPVFTQEDNGYQARYFPLGTVRSQSRGYDNGLFENKIAKVPKNSPALAAAADAERIADWIDFAVNENGIRLERTQDEIDFGLGEKAVYSDFLVLLRKKENLGLYAKELENRGIAYDISGGSIFNKSSELNEILRLFKAIEDDRDPVALVTALRGLFFGLGDDRLYDFIIAGGKFSFYGTVPEGFKEFKEAYARLARYKKIVVENEPLIAAEIIIEDLGIIPLAFSQEEGLTRAGNIYKALELLRDYKKEEINLFFDLVRNLEELLTLREVESLNLLASGKDVVRIMNLHKAKGLEAPVVILADPLGESKEFTPEFHISRTGSYIGCKSDNMSKGYFCIIKSNDNFGNDIIAIPPEWDDKSAEETKYDRAERKRLEYVAVTRAKNILVVSTYRDSTRAKAWEILYKYLEENNQQIPSDIKSSIGRKKEIVTLSIDQWAKEKEKIAEFISYLSVPSYRMTSVTTEAKGGFSFGTVDGIEKNGIEKTSMSSREWGILVHKALEITGRKNLQKVKAMAQCWVNDAGLGDESSVDLIDIAEKFSCSPLFARINKADKKYFEVPFALKLDDNIIHGVIDLVFLEGGKWVIVDYKTGDFEANEVQKSMYLKQLELYKKYWESISSQEVSETILYKV